MGLFDFFKKKKQAESSSPDKPHPDREMAKEDAAFQVSAKIKLTADEKRKRFYQLPERINLIEIAKIISGGEPEVVADFSLLVYDPQQFFQKHEAYCLDMVGGEPQSDDVLNLTAYWLVGHDTPFKYGGYIDWKEEHDDVIDHLEQAKEKLGYQISLDDIEFTYDEDTCEALEKIHQHLLKQGYTLATLCIYGDCYHLFIIPTAEYPRLKALGEQIGFEFFDDYQ